MRDLMPRWSGILRTGGEDGRSHCGVAANRILEERTVLRARLTHSIIFHHFPPVPSLDAAIPVDSLSTSCICFLGWLDQAGYESYDPYDIWGTRYGLWSRKVYYSNGKLGIPLVAPLVAMDLLWPSLRRLFMRKSRRAVAAGLSEPSPGDRRGEPS
jgi:hypothetical protein